MTRAPRIWRAVWALLGLFILTMVGLGTWILTGWGEMRVAGAPEPLPALAPPVAEAGIGELQPPPLSGPPYSPERPVDPVTPAPDRSPGGLERHAPENEETPRLPSRRPDVDDPVVAPLPQPPVPAFVPEGLVNAHVFGRDVYGLDPRMLERLQAAEQALTESGERDGFTPEERFGVASISGYRPGSRGHSRGIAVDINYYANPYIMHEKGEAELDAQLSPVYHRIARLMLGRDSVIPEQITEGSPGPDRTLRLYQQLREESRAMTGYFNLMLDRGALARHLRSLRRPVPSGADWPSPEALRQQMAADYVTLSGRPGPAAEGLAYPEPVPALRADGGPADRPFQGDARYRAPELGFMNLRPDLVRALTLAGLRWGATDFGNQSGDVMHFYLPESLLSGR